MSNVICLIHLIYLDRMPAVAQLSPIPKGTFKTHWTLGDVEVIVQVYISNRFIELIYGALPVIQVSATEPHWWQVNFGSGDALMPSDSEPLPKSMLIQICVAIWRDKSIIIVRLSCNGTCQTHDLKIPKYFIIAEKIANGSLVTQTHLGTPLSR